MVGCKFLFPGLLHAGRSVSASDLSVFLRILCTNYGQKVKNTDTKSAPEGVASITVAAD